jgi:hypothetical protein
MSDFFFQNLEAIPNDGKDVTNIMKFINGRLLTISGFQKSKTELK